MNIEQYTICDSPVPYKNIKIYPITIKDYVLFNTYSQCLLVNKNIIPDAKIISMTELEYIYYATKESIEDHPYLLLFDRLLSLCLKDDDSFKDMKESINRYNYDEKGKPYFEIGDERFTSVDFDSIKLIICEQNLVELPDDTMSQEVRDSLEKAREYKNKLANGNSKPASLEDYIISIAAVTGWTFEYVYGMTIRKFTKAIRRMDNLLHYKIYLSASMSGMVEFKDKSFIKHWLTGLDDEDKYKDVYMNLEDVQNKVSMESAKK